MDKDKEERKAMLDREKGERDKEKRRTRREGIWKRRRGSSTARMMS